MLGTAEHQAIHHGHAAAFSLAKGRAQVAGTAPSLHGWVALARDLVRRGARWRRWGIGERWLLLCHAHVRGGRWGGAVGKGGERRLRWWGETIVAGAANQTLEVKLLEAGRAKTVWSNAQLLLFPSLDAGSLGIQVAVCKGEMNNQDDTNSSSSHTLFLKLGRWLR